MARLLDVISYQGDNETLVYRSDIEDFNSHSMLVVNQSQEALFFKDGRALDLFGAGRYPLKTANFPIIRSFFEKIFNGKTPFPCQVYFINKTTSFNTPWGTDAPIVLDDPLYGILVSIKAYGSYSLKISDSRKFIVKVAGQLSPVSNRAIMKQVNGMILQTVKQNIAKTIVEQKVSILEVMTHLEEISSIIQAKLADEFDNLGLECQKFFIESINAEDKDLESLKTAKQQYASTIFEARGKAASREIQGFDYRTERQFDVLEGAAKNQGAGNVMAPGMGLGMGLGVGRVVSGEMENTAKAMRTETSTEKPAGTVKCPDCGFENKVGSKFCNNCGAKLSSEKFCPNCGAKYQEGQKFCGECGEKL